MKDLFQSDAQGRGDHLQSILMLMATGDGSARKHFVEATYQVFFSLAVGYCGGDKEEADEIVQDLYLRTFAEAARAADAPNPRAYLWRTLRGLAQTRRRADARRAAQLRRYGKERHLLAVRPGPVAPAEPDLAQVIQEEIGRLPWPMQELVRLIGQQEKTREAAAAMLGIPKATATLKYTQALALLRQGLVVRGVIDPSVEPLTMT